MSQTSTYDVDVVVAAIPTSMVVDIVPTEETPGNYIFRGYLERTDTGARLAGQTVNLVVDGAVVSSVVTSGAGFWDFEFALEPGATYAVKAVFPGTVDYEASETTTYPITPAKIPTEFYVIFKPPATVDAGVAFTFAGDLREVPAVPIGGKVVDLYVDGVLEATDTTEYDGAWSFPVVINEAGTHTVYAYFAGDVKYEGCFEQSPTRWLLPAGLLAGLVGIVCLRH